MLECAVRRLPSTIPLLSRSTRSGSFGVRGACLDVGGRAAGPSGDGITRFFDLGLNGFTSANAFLRASRSASDRPLAPRPLPPPSPDLATTHPSWTCLGPPGNQRNRCGSWLPDEDSSPPTVPPCEYFRVFRPSIVAQALQAQGSDGRQSPAMEWCVGSTEAVGFSSVRGTLRRISRCAQPTASGRYDAGACSEPCD